MSPRTRRRGPGAPPKAPGGLPEVLFVRTTRDLKRRLAAEIARARSAAPGLHITASDMVRMLLEEALGRRAKLRAEFTPEELAEMGDDSP